MDTVIEIVDIDEYDSYDQQGKNHAGYGNVVYRVTPDAQSRLRNMLLSESMWLCLTLVNGQRNIQQIADESGLSLDIVSTCLTRLELMSMICEIDAINLQKFLSARKKSGEVTAEQLQESISDNEDVDLLFDSEAEQSDCARPSKRSLNCLLELVRKRCTNKRYAELTMYRIFTGIPRELFLHAGIQSFLFIDEHTEVMDSDLISALVSETKKVLGFDVCTELSQCAHH